MSDVRVKFNISRRNPIRTVFKVGVAGTAWGSIKGNINDQQDLIDVLDLKANTSTVENEFGNVYTTIENNYTTLDNKIDTNQLQLSGDISILSTRIEGYNTALNNRINATNTTVSNNYSTLNIKINNNTQNINSLSNTINVNYTELNGKINTNKNNITAINNTLSGYGDIVTHNVSEFATSAQGILANTALQPNDNISELINNVGYITGISSADVITALDYTPYDSANPAGYITAASLPTVNNNTITIQKNNTDVGSFTLNQSSNDTINITVPTDTNDLTNGAGFITSAAIPTLEDLTTTTQLEAINSGATTINIGQIATNTTDIGNEVINRQLADTALQTQIDAIGASSDVFDIVGTYAELQSYDISKVPVNDIIKVLVDSTHNNAATYYRCVENNNVKSWSYIGSEGAYYTKGEADSKFVAQTITVNGQALSSNVTLTAADVGALSSSTTIGAGVLTIQKNGTAIDTFGANDTANTTINITVPTDTGDLTNNAGYITGITGTDVTTALGYTPYDATNPNGYTSNVGTVTSVNNISPVSGNVTLSIPTDTSDLTNNAGFITSSALSGYATETWVGQQGYITGITSTDVTTALGYTPYDSSNPSGYTSNVGTVISVNNEVPDANGNVTISTGGTVDQTYDPTSTNAQSGVAIAGAGFLTASSVINGGNA